MWLLLYLFKPDIKLRFVVHCLVFHVSCLALARNSIVRGIHQAEKINQHFHQSREIEKHTASCIIECDSSSWLSNFNFRILSFGISGLSINLGISTLHYYLRWRLWMFGVWFYTYVTAGFWLPINPLVCYIIHICHSWPLIT